MKHRFVTVLALGTLGLAAGLPGVTEAAPHQHDAVQRQDPPVLLLKPARVERQRRGWARDSR